MILGVHSSSDRTPACGWALLDPVRCTFEDLGVVITKPIKGGNVTLDRARRCNVQAGVLAVKAQGCDTVIVEQMTLPSDKAAVLPTALSWGVVLGIVASMDPKPRLLTIPTQRWQREVLPSAGKQVDYDELARAAAMHILRRHPKAALALRRIPETQRHHAIAAAMIALCAALRPKRCEQITAACRAATK